jgi:NAD-dependent SIR2 family protein deacetylase
MRVCKRCHDCKYQGTSGSFRSRWFMRCEECGRMIRPGKMVYVV